MCQSLLVEFLVASVMTVSSLVLMLGLASGVAHADNINVYGYKKVPLYQVSEVSYEAHDQEPERPQMLRTDGKRECSIDIGGTLNYKRVEVGEFGDEGVFVRTSYAYSIGEFLRPDLLIDNDNDGTLDFVLETDSLNEASARKATRQERWLFSQLQKGEAQYCRDIRNSYTT